MGYFIAPLISLRASLLLLVLGTALATTGCQQTGASSEPRAEPVDQHQSAPPRRGSY